MRRSKAGDCKDATLRSSKPVETDDISVLDWATAATSLTVLIATAVAAAAARAGETSGHSTAAASKCGVICVDLCLLVFTQTTHRRWHTLDHT